MKTTTTSFSQIVRRSAPQARVATRESLTFRRARATVLLVAGGLFGSLLGYLAGTGLLVTVLFAVLFVAALIVTRRDIESSGG